MNQYKWGELKLKQFATVIGRIGFRGYTTNDLVSEGEGALTLGAKHINKRNQIDISDPEYISWEKYYESPEIMVETGDMIVVQRGSIGKFAIINNDIGNATINPSLLLLKNIKCKKIFLYYFFSSRVYKHKIDVLISSTAVPMISQEQLRNMSVIMPPVEKQKILSDFLDKETSKIDNLIEKKLRLIELLQEKRQALITCAVTKGLDPNVPMNDSGIPWLGEVPEHWGLKKIKHLSPFISRGVSPAYIEDSEFPIINQSCIRWDDINLENVKFSSNDRPEQLKGYLHHLDVLVNSTGTGTLGRVAVIEKPKNMIADSHVTIIRTSKKLLNPYFLKYLLSTQTYQGFIYSYAVTGATNQIELSREKLREVPLYIPVLEEQDQIVSTVFRQEQTINKVTSKIQTQITKLQEYRQALITAAVTGKIDVREKVSS